MKKRLFPILIVGLTVISTARSAAAANSVPATPNFTIDGQPIQSTVVDPVTTQVPVPTTVTPIVAPAAPNPVSTGIVSSITSAVNAPVGNLIQGASSSLTNLATQQTSGVTSFLSNIPVVGSQVNTAIQQQISTSISGLTRIATDGFTNLIANSPLGGISSAIGNILGSLGLGGGGSNPNTASTQAAAQTAAINSTVDSYQAGASQAAALLAAQANPNIANIQIGLANTTPTGNIGTTVANVQGQQAVANIALNSNPTNGSLSQLDAITSSSNQVVAQSANGISGQADLQSRVSASSLNAAGMQTQAAQTYDNSLDQLNAISQQIGQQGAINAENVRIAAEQRTLTAAQLTQSASDAKARIRKDEDEVEQSQRIQKNVLNGQSIISGMVGVQRPASSTTTPATPATPATSAAASLLATP